MNIKTYVKREIILLYNNIILSVILFMALNKHLFGFDFYSVLYKSV